MREEMRKDRAEERPTARRGRTVKETVPMSGTNLWCRKKQERQGQEKRASYLLPITHRRFVRFGCISSRDVPIALGRFVRFVVGLALKAPDLQGIVVRRGGDPLGQLAAMAHELPRHSLLRGEGGRPRQERQPARMRARPPALRGQRCQERRTCGHGKEIDR